MGALRRSATSFIKLLIIYKYLVAVKMHEQKRFCRGAVRTGCVVVVVVLHVLLVAWWLL